jgi:hypothetical protein
MITSIVTDKGVSLPFTMDGKKRITVDVSAVSDTWSKWSWPYVVPEKWSDQEYAEIIAFGMKCDMDIKVTITNDKPMTPVIACHCGDFNCDGQHPDA